MRRFSLLFLLIAATSAAAQESPAAAPAAAASPAPAAPAAANASAPVAPTVAPTAIVSSRLAPGGVLETASTFPLGLQLGLSTSLGNGILAPGFQAQPAFSTSVSLSPTVKIPKIDGLPRLRLAGALSFSVNNWFSSFTNSGVYDRQVRVSDASARLIMPGVFTEEFTGIGASIVLGASLPLSINSRQGNLITGLSAAMLLSWSSPETGFGSFFAQYVPSVRASLFSQVGTTMPCGAQQQYGTPRPLGDPVNGLDNLPTFIPSSPADGTGAIITASGECLLQGRQRLATISNSLNAGWSTTDGAHSVSAGFGWVHGFLRPLSSRPELASKFASSQNFAESTWGSVSYSYTVPVKFPLQLSVSAGSEQGVYNARNELNFPFWDFRYPAGNASGVSFDLSVGI